MGKKKSGQTASQDNDSGGNGRPGTNKATGAGERSASPSTSALIICRNKHWRYISSFHGPWLQLPPEVLESLAHSNYLAPRPRPIDAAVLFDLVKIRRHVDEATTLAVRATSGLSSSSLHGGHSLLGPGAALGMGHGGGGGKLSRERKHRMRELATSKLSAAYRLDEIAASVATMQSASTLEDVAQLVLQRNAHDADAKYVHFFHEKIPSRMLAQCTPLGPLDDIIAERPTDGSALRTRALTRIFKDDFASAARDLTDALAAARYLQAQHRTGRDQLVLAREPRGDQQYGDQRDQQRDQQHDHHDHHRHHHHHRDRRNEPRIPDDDQPSSLEPQLLFHRAGVYLTIACAHVPAALHGLKAQHARDAHTPDAPLPAPAESRKQLRQNAKRALRDYMAFLAHFDYTPGLSAAAADDFLRRCNAPPSSHYEAKLSRLLDESSPAAPPVSEALTPYRRPPPAAAARWPQLPPPPLFALSDLFAAVPPASLPPYPPSPSAPAPPVAPNESVTYHPLLPDALHSLLLVHALLQTPPKELLRHAHNAARLLRLLDGYPIFLAARSPARSDWVEVLRRGGNWIGLGSSWESLCRGQTSAPTNGGGSSGHGRVARTGTAGANPSVTDHETQAQRRERQKHEAILEALADDRVVDEASFQRAVRAREQRFRDDEIAESERLRDAVDPPETPSRETPKENNPPNENGSQKENATPKERNDYPLLTPRAHAISSWHLNAPDPSLSTAKSKGKKKRRKAGGGVEPGVEPGAEVRKKEEAEAEGEGAANTAPDTQT